MPHLSAEAKHHILLDYAPRSSTDGLTALARRHDIRGGKRTLRNWLQQWDGSAESLKRKPGSGKARVLNRAQVSRHVRAPILAANRAHRAISYAELLPLVRQRTDTEVSLRSLQRYGREELGAMQRRSKKRTAAESEYSAACEREQAPLVAEYES